MGTKPAKVGRLVPCLLNQGSNPGNKPGIPVNSRIRLFLAVFAKRSSLRGWTKVAKVGPPWARVKFAKVRPTPYVYYPGWLHLFETPRENRWTVKEREGARRTATHAPDSE